MFVRDLRPSDGHTLLLRIATYGAESSVKGDPSNPIPNPFLFPFLMYSHFAISIFRFENLIALIET